MHIAIKITNSGNSIRPPGIVLYLRPNNWDDYGHKTTFHLIVEDERGKKFEIGDVKIGSSQLANDSWVVGLIHENCPGLDEHFFSLGQDTIYYERLYALPKDFRNQVLAALRDVVANPAALAVAEGTRVFQSSLMRSVSAQTLSQQYSRILRGEAPLTKFHFGYSRAQTNTYAGISLEFRVTPNSTPPTNIHVLIGRNGIGKTTLLNGMISSLVGDSQPGVDYGNIVDLSGYIPIQSKTYFSHVISTSFSAFDPFTPPPNRHDENAPVRYTYVGLKEVTVQNGYRVARHKDIHELAKDFVDSLDACLTFERKRELWLNAIECLSSDTNFAEMDLGRLAYEEQRDVRLQRAHQFFTLMSSGHAVVLLTLTTLVERTEEKTVIIMDEPESHLHPPLLSAFVRALSMLLTNRNGVAIIATHSPVILQEVPKSCVWKMRRTRLTFNAERPEEETFGENVGILTREVFGLEVSASGFHNTLKSAVEAGRTYEQILSDYGGQIGFEGRTILRALISSRVL